MVILQYPLTHVGKEDGMWSYYSTLSHINRFSHLGEPERAPHLASFPGVLSPNAVEGLVKLVRRMTSGGRLEAWLIRAVHT